MIQAVLLDLDGTLLDTNYLHVEAWARALKEVGLQVPRATLHRQIGKGADQFLPEFVDDEARRERANELHGRYYESLVEHAYALPGASALLRALAGQGLRLWLATSAKPDELERMLPLLDAADCLTGVVSAEDVATSKPAPDIFRTTLVRAEVAPARAIVVGDTIWDVQAATGAGVRAVGVTTGGAYDAAELSAAGAIAVYADCAAALAAGFPGDLAL